MDCIICGKPIKKASEASEIKVHGICKEELDCFEHFDPLKIVLEKMKRDLKEKEKEMSKKEVWLKQKLDELKNFEKNLVPSIIPRNDKATGQRTDFFWHLSLLGKRINIAGHHRRCSLLTIEPQASPELMRFAYDTGLGEKNAMGF